MIIVMLVIFIYEVISLFKHDVILNMMWFYILTIGCGC
jgi:hypothetical protein